MPATDPSTPPLRGLARLKRNPGDNGNDSTNSLVSSSNSDDPTAEAGVGLRPSSAGGIGKLADRLRRRSVDDRRDSADAGNRLSALLPGRRNKLKRTKSSDLKVGIGAEDDICQDQLPCGLPNNHSDSSLVDGGSGRSSLFTEDNSDHEG